MPKMTMSVRSSLTDRSAGPSRARRVDRAAGRGRPDALPILRARWPPTPTSPRRGPCCATSSSSSAVAITLYLIYLLRRPIGWIVIATFLAIAMSGPVNFLHRHLGRRGIAIGLSYFGLLLDAGRARRDHRAAGRDRRERPRQRRAALRRRRPGLRAEEQDPARPREGLRRRHEARAGGGQAPQPPRRRGRDAARRRARPRQLDLRRGHDHRAQRVHGRRGAGVAAQGRGAHAARARGAHRPHDRPDGDRGRQLRRGGTGAGDDRRDHDVHRPDDPRRAVRGAAVGRRVLLRPDPARRRDDRGDRRRDRDGVRRTSRRRRSSG